MPDQEQGLDIAAMLADAPKISDTPAVVEPGQQGKPPEGTVEGKPSVVEPQQKPEGTEADGGKLGPDGKPIVTKPADGTVPPPPVPQAQPPAPGLSAEDLRRQTEAIAKLLEGQKSQEKTPPGKPEPPFKVEIPQQLLAAMASEDPTERGTATNFVINGAMNAVYSKIAQEMTTRFEQIMEHIPRLVEQRTTAQTKTKEIYDDFYGKYPTLKNEALVPLIQQRAKALATAKGDAFVWDEKFRDELGADVMGIISSVAGKPAATPPAPKVQPKEPPFSAGKTPRVDGSGKNPFLDAIGV